MTTESSVQIYSLFILGTILILTTPVKAQKEIIINDSLAGHSEKLIVNMGSLKKKKIQKFSFGEYAIVSSKVGRTTESTQENFFQTKTESRSDKRFSFVVSNHTTDSASVDAAHNSLAQLQQKIKLELGNGWYLGGAEQGKDSDNFTAFITINGDTTDTWVLMITAIANTEGGYQTFQASKTFLTNGERTIFLVPASSNKNGEVPHTVSILSMPALGFEFVENEHPLAAVQYFGVAFAKSTNIVWLHKGLDAKMNLILASAMTAVLLLNSPSSPIH